MAEHEKKWDLKWIFGTSIMLLGLWMGWQQLTLTEIQNAVQQRNAEDQKRLEEQQLIRQEQENEEKQWPKVSVSRQGHVVHILVTKTHPVTKVETKDEITTDEEGWKELHEMLLQRRKNEHPPSPRPLK